MKIKIKSENFNDIQQFYFFLNSNAEEINNLSDTTMYYVSFFPDTSPSEAEWHNLFQQPYFFLFVQKIGVFKIAPSSARPLFSYLLQNGRCRSGMRLELQGQYNSKLDSEDLKYLSESLMSENSPEALTLDLSYNDLDNESLKYLANALMSGKCPKGLNLILNTLDCGSPGVGIEGARLFADALMGGKCPEGFGLKFFSDSFGAEGCKYFSTALMSGNCPERLTLGLDAVKPGFEGAAHFVISLMSGKCPDGLTLTFRDQFFGEQLPLFAQALMSGNCPEDLTLDFSYISGIEVPDILYLSMALLSGKCPKGLSISLKSIYSDCDMAPLLNTLTSRECPERLTLDLSYTGFIRKNFVDLKSVLMSGKCPHGLTLILQGIRNNDHHYARELATVLTSGKCPSDLTLGFRCHDLGSEGIEFFINAIKTGNCPDGLTLKFLDEDCHPDFYSFIAHCARSEKEFRQVFSRLVDTLKAQAEIERQMKGGFKRYRIIFPDWVSSSIEMELKDFEKNMIGYSKCMMFRLFQNKWNADRNIVSVIDKFIGYEAKAVASVSARNCSIS